MSLVKKNIIANFFGKAIQAILNLLLVPLYIHFLGIESYGLVGIYTMIQGISFIFDIGLGATITRELARLKALPDRNQEARNLAYSLQIIYWCLAMFIGVVIVLLSSPIANNWVKADQLSPIKISEAIKIMGISIALQWPVSFYSGGLTGLQKQVLNNVISIIMNIVKGGGALIIIWIISPTIQAFFIWQAIVGLTFTVVMHKIFWSMIPGNKEKLAFKSRALANSWKFAAGVSGISILATIMIQVDKFVLTKLVTLEVFGYYTLAGVISLSLFNIITPLYNAIYPRFVELISKHELTELEKLYHKSCQLMSVLIFPVAAVLFFYSNEILQVWTQNTETARNTSLLMSMLVLSSMLGSTLQLPGGIQYAFGWTKLIFFINLFSFFWYIPVVILLTFNFGVNGAAISAIILQIVFIMFEIPLMHRKILKNEKLKWFIFDVGLPFILSMVFVAFSKIFFRGSMPHWEIVILVTMICIVTFIITAIMTPVTREWIQIQMNKMKIRSVN